MSSKRYAQVDKEYCVSCGTCTKACPLQAISVPDGISAVVELCSNKDKGPAVTKVCANSCIGCGLCARECPASVIKVVTADV